MADSRPPMFCAAPERGRPRLPIWRCLKINGTVGYEQLELIFAPLARGTEVSVRGPPAKRGGSFRDTSVLHVWRVWVMGVAPSHHKGGGHALTLV